MSKLAERQEQKALMLVGLVGASICDGWKAVYSEGSRIQKLLDLFAISGMIQMQYEYLARKPDHLFSTKSPRLDKRRVRRYNRKHKVRLVYPNTDDNADTQKLIDAINAEIAL